MKYRIEVEWVRRGVTDRQQEIVRAAIERAAEMAMIDDPKLTADELEIRVYDVVRRVGIEGWHLREINACLHDCMVTVIDPTQVSVWYDYPEHDNPGWSARRIDELGREDTTPLDAANEAAAKAEAAKHYGVDVASVKVEE